MNRKHVIAASTLSLAFALNAPVFAHQQHSVAASSVPNTQPILHNNGVQKGKNKNRDNKKIETAELASAEEIHRYVNPLMHYYGGTPVVTSPYLGSRSRYDGGHLIINFGDINEDLVLLDQYKTLQNTLIEQGYPLPSHPIVDLSGKIIAFGYVSSPFSGKSNSDIDLLSSTIDTAILVNPWVQGLISFKYDNAAPRFGGQRTRNSRLFLNKGFLTIGNFRESPWYFTAGQIYVPFGVYSTNLISSTLPSLIGKTQARVVEGGFKSQGDNSFNASVYLFEGDTRVAGQNVFGSNLGYYYSVNGFQGLIGAGIISNMAEAIAIQGTGGEIFPGFGSSPQTEVMEHRVPSANVNARVAYKQYFLKGEYNTATTDFNPMDLSFNNHGAHPWAYQIEGGINFDVHQHPSAIALAYGRSGQALALNLPEQSFFVVFSTTPWRNTLFAIEYRHDENYPKGTEASGRGGLTVTPQDFLGRTADTVSASLALYF